LYCVLFYISVLYVAHLVVFIISCKSYILILLFYTCTPPHVHTEVSLLLLLLYLLILLYWICCFFFTGALFSFFQLCCFFDRLYLPDFLLYPWIAPLCSIIILGSENNLIVLPMHAWIVLLYWLTTSDQYLCTYPSLCVYHNIVIVDFILNFFLWHKSNT